MITPRFTCFPLISSSATCRKALGMQSGHIPDDAITASSAFDDKSVGPANGRYVPHLWCSIILRYDKSKLWNDPIHPSAIRHMLIPLSDYFAVFFFNKRWIQKAITASKKLGITAFSSCGMSCNKAIFFLLASSSNFLTVLSRMCHKNPENVKSRNISDLKSDSCEKLCPQSNGKMANSLCVGHSQSANCTFWSRESLRGTLEDQCRTSVSCGKVVLDCLWQFSWPAIKGRHFPPLRSLPCSTLAPSSQSFCLLPLKLSSCYDHWWNTSFWAFLSESRCRLRFRLKREITCFYGLCRQSAVISFCSGDHRGSREWSWVLSSRSVKPQKAQEH